MTTATQTPEHARCSACRWWIRGYLTVNTPLGANGPTGAWNSQAGNSGECRVDPPVQGATTRVYPRTFDFDGCHKARM